MIHTIETRLRLDPTQYDEIYSCVDSWSHGYHKTWRLYNNDHLTEKQIYDYWVNLNVFTTYQVKSLISKVTTEHSKIKALTKTQLQQKESKLAKIQKFITAELKAIEDLNTKIIKLKTSKKLNYKKITEHNNEIKTKTEVLAAKQKKIQRLEKSIRITQTRLDTNTFKLCFGSARMLKQHPKHPTRSFCTSTSQQVYQDTRLWKEDWRLARNNIWYATGDKTKPHGNAEIQYDPDSKKLKLRVTEVEYHHRLDIIADTLKIPLDDLLDHDNVKYSVHRMQARFMVVSDVSFCSKNHAKLVAALNNKQPISAKIMKRRCPDHSIGFYLQLSFTEVINYTFPPNTNLTMGVDLNQKGLAYAIVKEDGNKYKHAKGDVKPKGFLVWNLKDKTTEQREWIISNTISKLLVIAQTYNITNIAIENLDFSDTMNTFNTGYKGHAAFNKMLTQFAKTQFSTMIQRKTERLGMRLQIVNPAYSSVGGYSKYGVMNKLQVDIAASLWLARQGMFGKRFKSESNTEHIALYKEEVSFPYSSPSKQSKRRGLAKVKWKDIASALGRDRKCWYKRTLEYIRPKVDSSLSSPSVGGR